MSLTQIFHQLEGGWRFQRTFSIGGRVEGNAEFTKCSDAENTLNYREDGSHTSSTGQTYSTYMNYIYRYQNDKISVYFFDGRFFHTLDFNDKSNRHIATGIHLCVCDTYKARYSFLDKDRFELFYKVEGPHKDYTIQTQFMRINS